MDVQQLASEAFSAYLYICGMIAATGGVVALVVKFWKYAHKTSDKNAVTIGEVLEFLANDKSRIEKLEYGQRKLEALNTLQLETQIMLLDQVGNDSNMAQVNAMKSKIQAFLIKEGVAL